MITSGLTPFSRQLPAPTIQAKWFETVKFKLGHSSCHFDPVSLDNY
jgi:hypothetical protein